MDRQSYLRDKEAVERLSSAERDVLRQLFFHGPTWDGDLTSKTGRDGLVDRGLATRKEGWQQLSEAGFHGALILKFDDEKERWERRRASR